MNFAKANQIPHETYLYVNAFQNTQQNETAFAMRVISCATFSYIFFCFNENSRCTHVQCDCNSLRKKTKNQQTNQVQRYRKSNKEIAKPKLETKQNETNNKSIVNW